VTPHGEGDQEEASDKGGRSGREIRASKRRENKRPLVTKKGGEKSHSSEKMRTPTEKGRHSERRAPKASKLSMEKGKNQKKPAEPGAPGEGRRSRLGVNWENRKKKRPLNTSPKAGLWGVSGREGKREGG